MLEHPVHSFSVDDGIRDTEHLQDLCKGWRKTVREKYKKSRSTGESGEARITNADEMMYSLLMQNENLVGGYKVHSTLIEVFE